MRIILPCKKIFFFFLLFAVKPVIGQKSVVLLDSTFTGIDLQKIARTYATNENLSLAEFYNNTINAPLAGDKPIFYSGLDSNIFLGFVIKNTGKSTLKLMLELSSAVIYEINFYEVIAGDFSLVNISGSGYPIASRPSKRRNFVYPVKLQPNEQKSIFIRFRTAHTSLVVPGRLYIEDAFEKSNLIDNLFIGFYFGLSFFTLILSLFVFSFTRNSIFLTYSLYLLFLTLSISLFLGVFFQFFDRVIFENNLYLFLIATEFSIVFFVVFTQKLLNAKAQIPRLYKAINIILIITVSLRLHVFLLPEFYFKNKQFILQAWYIGIIFIIVGLLAEIIVSFKYQKKTTVFFSFAYFFILFGMFITILHFQKGMINSFYFGLPVLLYASIFEIIFLTISLANLFKSIYIERNLLSEKVIEQQKQILSSFMDGEEQERKRIGIELHDNIGSKLSHLSHKISENQENIEIKTQLNEIFQDVRNLSHRITPVDFKMVGLKGAIGDLVSRFKHVSAIDVEFSTYDFKDHPGNEICLNLYRITQETLNNIARHSGATHVEIQLIEFDDNINLSIEDNGVGFDTSLRKSGIGLKNIRTRVNQLNGYISLESSPGNGTSLLVSVPKN